MNRLSHRSSSPQGSSKTSKLSLGLIQDPYTLGYLSTQSEAPEALKFFTHFFPPDFAATGQFISELAFSLDELGLPVTVFTSQPGYAFRHPQAKRFEKFQNVFVWRSRLAKIWGNRIRGKLAQGLLFSLRCFAYFLRRRNRKGLFVFTTAPSFLGIFGYLMHKIFGIKYVCLVYDLYPDILNALDITPKNSLISKIWRSLNHKAWRRARKIIVLSTTMRDRIVHQCPAVQHKIHIIHNWADHQVIKPIPKHKNWFAIQHGLDQTFTVLYSGNMGRCHDIETLYETVQILKDHPIRFLFIGGGAKREIIEQKIRQAQINGEVTPNICFLPYQELVDIPFSLTACDLSIVSISPGMEGLVVPSKLYSSLAIGRPVAAICESHSYLCDLLAEANCGQTFRNGDAQALANYILALKNSPELVTHLGRNGRQYLEHNFTRKIIAAKYFEVLSEDLLKPTVTTQTLDVLMPR